MRNPKKSYTVDEAKSILENYCAYQERCHKEVENKLYELGIITEGKEIIILHLLQNNYLNEERFARTFARGKFSIKKWGKLKIKNELKFKGVSDYNITKGLSEISDEDYEKTLIELAEKKLPTIKEPNSYRKKNKLVTYLTSKGYEYTAINNVCKSLFN